MILTTTQTGDGIREGVEANGPEFKVNGRQLRILSGSLHYFRFSHGFKAHNLSHRVHPEYWQTRLRQYKVLCVANLRSHMKPIIQAAGLNVVDVYVPWNLHEPRRGDFDFGRAPPLFSSSSIPNTDLAGLSLF